MNLFLSKLLGYYQMSAEDLVRRKAPGSFVHLTLPDGKKDFDEVIQRLKKAMDQKEKVVIYGDYDVDGLTSTAILVLALKRLGLNPGFFIPSRYKEGYGLNEERVRQFKEKGYSLIITVDNGISAFSAIDLARSLGMEVVVIDHHEIQDTLPNTPYIFHQAKSGFISYNCSAASLAFFVSHTLLKEFDPYFATLAGIAVFSDVMPLEGNNLELAKLSLAFLKEKKYPNLVSLMNGEISYASLSFNLIPALNSPGRIGMDSLSTINACRFLLSPEEGTKKYAFQFLQMNAKRRDIVKHMTFEENKKLESEHAGVYVATSYSGLSGLFANRLMQEKNKPILVFATLESNPEYYCGSLRLPEGYSSLTFMKNGKFVAGGGHERAAGITIKKEDFYQVAVSFCSEMEKQSLEKKMTSQNKIPLDLEDLNRENYGILEQFMPFGEGFKEPKFSVSFGKEDVVYSKNGTSFFVYCKNKEGKVVYFKDHSLLDNPEASFFTVEGSLKEETFQGKTMVSLFGEKLLSE